ncbi:MAG: hypothetical protein WAN50_00445 [Minisyncoccia bacterium]
MLTEGNLKYLQTISDVDIVHVAPFDPGTQKTAASIMSQVRQAIPTAKIFYFGSSALGIAGENDIDLGVIDAGEYGSCGRMLQGIFGEPIKVDEKQNTIRWEFVRSGFTIELFLSDVLAGRILEHINTHERLVTDENLRNAYEKLKQAADGLSKREYMKRKLEFFNTLAL